MRSIKQKIALAAGLGLIATAAILMAFGLYSTSNTKERSGFEKLDRELRWT